MLTRNPNLAPILLPSQKAIDDYVRAMRWVGWGPCELGPPIDLHPLDEYPVALIGYLGCRLMDDGIDAHSDYKGRVPSLFGHLAGELSVQKAGALSVMTGAWILNASLRRLVGQDCLDAAAIILRLSTQVAPGVLAEALCQRSISLDVYQSIVQRKSVAYDMMLNQIFFRQMDSRIKPALLAALASLSKSGQWLNDLGDAADDHSRGQMNLLAVLNKDRTAVFETIIESLQKLCEKNNSLPSALRDGLASRMMDIVEKLILLADP
jgi:hypothetical protein